MRMQGASATSTLTSLLASPLLMAFLTAASSKASTVVTDTPMPRQSAAMSTAGPLERSACSPVPG